MRELQGKILLRSCRNCRRVMCYVMSIFTAVSIVAFKVTHNSLAAALSETNA
jgi:hypothetical protein